MPIPTRLSTEVLDEALEHAMKGLDDAHRALAKILVLMTPAERRTLANPPSGFVEAGQSLARAVAEHSALAQAAGFDVEAVLEDLRNVERLTPVMERAEALARLLGDARLAWLHEAFQPSLRVHAIAKRAMKHEPAFQRVAEPLGRVFGKRGRRRAEASTAENPPKSETDPS